MPRQNSEQIRRFEDLSQRRREAEKSLDAASKNISPRLALALERLQSIKKFFSAIIEAPDPLDDLEQLHQEFTYGNSSFLEESDINAEVVNDIENCIYLVDNLGEAWRYIPIGLSACIETYFKQVYTYLIDNGASVFKKNAIDYLKGKRNQDIHIEVLLSLDNGKFTLGEFLAQLLWSRDLDDINLIISDIVGRKNVFSEAIKKELKNDVLYKAELIIEAEYNRITGQVNLFDSMGVELPTTQPYPDSTLEPQEVLDSLKTDIKALFDLRNRFSHEAYITISRNDERLIQRSVNSVQTFLWASDFSIEKLVKNSQTG